MGKKSKRPLISVITCTRNSGCYISDNLRSVARQSFKDFEHIFVDGFSDDSTIDKIKDYKKTNKNVRLYSQKPSGISNAMNYGIHLARGKYIIHLHSDDAFASKTSLEKIAELIKIKNPQLVVGKIIETDEDGKNLGTYPPGWLFALPSASILLLNFIPHQGAVVAKSVFKQYGKFDPNYKYCMDYDFWQRVYGKIHVSYINFPISRYRVHNNSMSASSTNQNSILKEYAGIQHKYSPLYLHPVILVLRSAIRTYLRIKRYYLKTLKH